MDAVPNPTQAAPFAGRSAALRGGLALLVAAALVSGGCSRAFYRRQADVDAYSLVREKADHPHWRLDDYTIAIDPRSRMYDPFCLDCPPMPPDDPTSHQLMHCVDNKRGWPFWHDNGDTPFVANPAWPEYIEVDERGILQVSADDAVRLALLHSPDYQSQLEELYLSALDVSFERFRFDSQFFAGYEAFGIFTGPVRSGRPQGSSILELNTRDWRMRKLFPTGAEMVVGFANSLVWQFAGNNDYNSTTLVDFALVQPLLRNAGRDRILERLTVAERTLLANVRAMEQYRQAFYVDVMTGRNATGGPNRRGGVFGAGLEGFTGFGGGFGAVGGGGGGGAGGTGGDTGAGAPAAGGYLGLLQSQRQIRNQEDNVRRLRRNLSRLTFLLQEQPSEQTGAYLNQGLQVAQARQALINAESTLLNSRNNYEAQLDLFKATLGLPPQVCLQPQDKTLNQFELIDPAVIRLPEVWENILTEHSQVRREIPERITDPSNLEVVVRPEMDPLCRLKAYEGLESDLAQLQTALAAMQEFVDRIVADDLPAIRQDLDKFGQALPRRREWLAKLRGRVEESSQSPCDLLPLAVNPLAPQDISTPEASAKATSGLIDRLVLSIEDASHSHQMIQQDFEILSNNFQQYAAQLASRGKAAAELLERPAATDEERFQRLVQGIFNPAYKCGETKVLSIDVVEDVTRELTELQLIQAIARAEAIELQDIDMRADQALEVARRYRRDWMNARAGLVDSWRLIQFQSDQLQGGMSILFNGDLANVGQNPFDLRATNGRLTVGAQFDAPLTRLAERNTYRQAIIEYQQARRAYYQFEDTVGRSLRAELRRVTTNQLNFELQRRAVIMAARQVMLNTLIDQEEQRTLTTRVTAARDAVQALSDLLNAQNDFMGIWVNYEVLRYSLDLDLGTMQLDSEGLWIDPGKFGPDYGKYDPWLWRTEGCLPGDMQPHPAAPGGATEGETLPEVPGTPILGQFQRDPVLDLPPPLLLPPAQDVEVAPGIEFGPPPIARP